MFWGWLGWEAVLMMRLLLLVLERGVGVIVVVIVGSGCC